MPRAQAAMEYLMTFGWAFLMISIAAGVLFQLGAFNTLISTPRAPPGSCQTVRTNTQTQLVGKCNGLLPQYVASFTRQQSSYVDVGQHESYLANSVSFVAWVKLRDNYGGGYGGPNIISVFNRSPDRPYHRLYTYGPWGGVATWNFNGVGSGTPKTVLKDLRWHQVAMTVVMSGATAIYVDANSVNSVSVSGSEPVPLNVDLVIGALITGGVYVGNALPTGVRTDSFNGMISNVQFYNTTLTQNEITDLYLEGMGGAPINLQNLVGWWLLNGDTNDYSGNGNNGVPNNLSYVAQYGN
jgi:hypothetical protein